MMLPPGTEPPPEPHPVAGGDWFPHIVYHDIQDDGTVLVTWALPGLTNATIRVPLTSWLNGEHARTGHFLGTLITPLLPRPYNGPVDDSDYEDEND